MSILVTLSLLLSPAQAASSPASDGGVADSDIVYRGACDGSAGAMLPGGLFVSANDENNILRVYRIGQPDRLVTADLDVSPHLGITGNAEADLEAVAPHGDRLYWISSHGRKGSGDPAPKRQRFFATSWDGTHLRVEGSARSDLLPKILAAPETASLNLGAIEARAPKDGGINIEGLASGEGQALLLGFRSPLIPHDAPDGRAILLPLLNGPELIASAVEPRFAAPILLNLGGRGIRSIERDAGSSYLIVAGPVGESADFALFRWTGRPADDPQLVGAQMAPLAPEGLIPLGDGSVLVLSDDGSDACKSAPAEQQSFRGRRVMPGS